MNAFEKFLYFLQGTMERPVPWGWFHWLWIGLTFISIVLLCVNKDRSNAKLNKVLFVYGIIAFILELTKQVIWSFNYDPVTGIKFWHYEWYAAPFQLCTTPIYVSLLIPFIKNKRIRNNLLSFLAYYTILGGISTILMPDSCFVKTIEVNIHTMFLHCGSFVISMYLIISNTVKRDWKNVFNGFKVFIVFVVIALLLDLIIYNSGILRGDTFNMFYISPYFISSLPVYSSIQQSVPYILFLMFYILSIFLGANVIYCLRIFILFLYNRGRCLLEK